MKDFKTNFMQVIENSERCLNGHPVTVKLMNGMPWRCGEPSCEYYAGEVSLSGKLPSEHPTPAEASSEAPKPPQPSFEVELERLLIELYETALLHGEAQANGVGVTLPQRETTILVALNEALAAHQDSVREKVNDFIRLTSSVADYAEGGNITFRMPIKDYDSFRAGLGE